MASDSSRSAAAASSITLGKRCDRDMLRGSVRDAIRKICVLVEIQRIWMGKQARDRPHISESGGALAVRGPFLLLFLSASGWLKSSSHTKGTSTLDFSLIPGG